jgi:hypothetical protein
MKRLLWYVGCCWMLSLSSAPATYASPEKKPSTNTLTSQAASLGKFSDLDRQMFVVTPVVAKEIFAQVPPPPPAPTETPPNPSSSEDRDLQERLNNLKNPPAPVEDKFSGYEPKTSPSFSIINPVGFGADNNLFFFGLSYQNRTRYSQNTDGQAGIGIGLGDAVNSIGAELSYTINSFGSSSSFGSGAFNAKLHKRLGDDSAVAIGWNQFANIYFGSGRQGNFLTDYPKNSYYAVGTKIFRTREDINEPFSRVAVTGGVGSGVFLPEDRTIAGLDRTGLNGFGSIGVRIARPVSAVVEWTGQDLAAGVSIAPFDNFPLVISPSVRDITGAGDGARFIVSAGVAFNF